VQGAFVVAIRNLDAHSLVGGITQQAFFSGMNRVE